MKVKVLIPFRDKETKKEHAKGDVIEISAARVNEIIKQGAYIQLVEDTKPTQG